MWLCLVSRIGLELWRFVVSLAGMWVLGFGLVL